MNKGLELAVSSRLLVRIFSMRMVVEWRKKKKQSTLLVGVNVGACNRELLTWVLVKVAREGDHVIVVHVVTTSAGMNER